MAFDGLPRFITIVDSDNLEVLESHGQSHIVGPRYVPSILENVLCFLGFKQKDSIKLTEKVFQYLAQIIRPVSRRKSLQQLQHIQLDNFRIIPIRNSEDLSSTEGGEGDGEGEGSYSLVIPRKEFVNVVCYQCAVVLNRRCFVGDLKIAMDVLEGSKSVCILLCGTSGTGKSTLASLLGQALGITTIVSTDSVRHMLRGFTDKEQDPVLWASTYEAGAVLQCHEDILTDQARVIKGYKQQSETVIKCVEKLIKSHAKRRQSLIVEGVHLSLGYVMRLMAQNPEIIPFLICIQNEAKHKEHFAVRAKYMTMEPSQNKYVRNFKNIRLIQDYLCRKADKYLIPKVNNTNVDRSIAVIHSTVVRCLRRIADGDQLLENNVAQVVNSEFEQIKSQMWSGKDMLSAIKESKEQSSKKSPIPANVAVAYISEEHMSERSSSDVLQLLEGPSSDLEFEQLRGTGDLEGIDQLGDEEEGSIVDPTTDHYTEEEEDAGSPTKLHPHLRKPLKDAKTFTSFPEH